MAIYIQGMNTPKSKPKSNQPPEAQEVGAGTAPHGRVQIGDLAIDLDDRIVRRRDGDTTPLQEKPFLLLLCLLRHPGRLMTREELIEELWPPGLHVDFEHGLNTAVKKLRHALDDSAREPRYIETLPRRGYRLLAEAGPVALEKDETPADESHLELEDQAAKSNRLRLRQRWTGIAAMIGLASLAALRLEPAGESQPATATSQLETAAENGIRLAVMPFRNLDASEEGVYLAECLTEEVVTALGAVAPTSLHLIASSSTLRFRGTELPADVIGATLGADYLVTGSLRRDGDRSRVSIQVIHAATHEQLWSHSYDLRGDDLLTMQSRVAYSLVCALPEALREPTLQRPAAKDCHEVRTG